MSLSKTPVLKHRENTDWITELISLHYIVSPNCIRSVRQTRISGPKEQTINTFTPVRWNRSQSQRRRHIVPVVCSMEFPPTLGPTLIREDQSPTQVVIVVVHCTGTNQEPLIYTHIIGLL